MAGRIRRVDKYVRNSPPVLLVLLLLFLVATGSEAAGRVQAVWDYFHRPSWRSVEYAKLAQLRAGETLGTFEHLLGAPLIEQTKGGFDEYTFRGRDFWVQAVTRHRSPSTRYFAVTSCALNFNPTFVLSDGTKVVLNRNHLADVNASKSLDIHSDYFFPGATGDAWFYDSYPGINPTNYTSFAWGFDDACLNLLPSWYSLESPALVAEVGAYGSAISGRADEASTAIRQFRRKILVNTFAVTAASASFGETNGIFQLGVDRIEIRPITNQQVAPKQAFNPPRQPRKASAKPPPLPPPLASQKTVSQQLHQLMSCTDSPLRPYALIESPNSFFFESAGLPASLTRATLQGLTGGAFFKAVFFSDRRGASRDAGDRTWALVFVARDTAAAKRVAAAIRRLAPRLHVDTTFGDVVYAWSRPPDQQEQDEEYVCA